MHCGSSPRDNFKPGTTISIKPIPPGAGWCSWPSRWAGTAPNGGATGCLRQSCGARCVTAKSPCAPSQLHEDCGELSVPDPILVPREGRGRDSESFHPKQCTVFVALRIRLTRFVISPLSSHKRRCQGCDVIIKDLTPYLAESACSECVHPAAFEAFDARRARDGTRAAIRLFARPRAP